MAKEVEIKAVATSSYYEFGNVQFVEIAGGNIVIEAEANVTALHFDATNNKFVNSNGQKISVDLSKANNIPSFSRDNVNIDETDGTFVAKVKTSEEDYIWLTKAGIIEQVTLSDSDTSAGSNYANITDTNYDIADQIANNAVRGEEGRPIKADTEEEMTEQELANLTSASQIIVQNPTKETVIEIATQGHLSVEEDTCVAVLDKTIMRTGQNKGGVEDEANTARIKEVLAQCDSFEDIVDKINAGEFDSGFVHARGVKSNDVHGLLISGDIKLTKDLYINPAHALSFRFVIDGNSLGEDKTMTIDLNGHKVVQLCGGQAGGSSGYCLFTIRNDAIINIIDSSFGEAGSIIGNHCVFDIYEGCQINLYRGTLTLNDTIAAYDYAFDNDYTEGNGSAVVTLDGVSSINIYGGNIINRTNVKIDPNHLSALIDSRYSPLHTDYVSSSVSQYGTWYTYDTGWKTVNSKAIHKFSGSTTINNIGGTIEGLAE